MAAPVLYTQTDFHNAWALRNGDIQAMARTPRADLFLRYFDIRLSTGSDVAEWAPFQIKVLNETATFSSYNKSRQIGMSFILAGDALAEAILTPRHTEIMISYNIEEAKEKIIYARAWWDSKHPKPSMVPARGEYDPTTGVWLGRSPKRLDRWPELIKINALELMFDNGSRLISHPSRPPRGKSASVIGDEAAHVQNFNAIYQAALPMITRGHNKRIKLASTPKGASGRWWEIHTNAGNNYKDFVRHECGWWEISELCTDINGARRAVAAGIDLDELVVRFGTAKMRTLRGAQLEEDYLQEFGLVFLDSIHAFLSWDLIRSCHPAEIKDKLDMLYSMVGEEPDFASGQDVGFDASAVQHAQDMGYFYRIARCRNGVIDSALEAIRDMARWIAETNPDGAFGWAYDIGRDRDASEITVFQFSGNRAMQRLMITMPQLHSDLQEAIIRALMNALPISSGLMDQNGIGRLLADRLTSQYGYDRITPAWFTPGNKDKWAVNLKLEMQRRRVSLIPDRDQDQQLHSVKRTISATARVFTFEVEDDSSADSSSTKKEHHHADKFWTVAMGVYLGIQYQEGREIAGGGGGEERSRTSEVLDQIGEKGHATTGRMAQAPTARSSKTSSVMRKIRRKT